MAAFDPIKLVVKNLPANLKTIEVPLNPKNPQKGTRTISVSNEL